MSIRDTDITILNKLRNNARLQHSKLAREMHWPVSTTQERVQRCLDRYVLRSVALVDYERLGYGNRAIWIVRPHGRHKDSWERKVAGHGSVNIFSRLHHGEYFIESVTRGEMEQAELRKVISAEATVLSMHPIITQLTHERFLADAGCLPAIASTGGNSSFLDEHRP